MAHENFGEFFKFQCRLRPNKSAIGWVENQKEIQTSFQNYYEEIESLALGFHKQGLEKGDPLGILASTSVNWNKVDIATLSLGSVVIPIYPTLMANEIGFIVNHSEMKFLFLDSGKQLEKVVQVLTPSSKLKKIITDFDPTTEEEELLRGYGVSLVPLALCLEAGKEEKKQGSQLFIKAISKVASDDIATIIYTSGTTGEPKGCVIHHKTILQMFSNIQKGFEGSITEKDKTLCLLPLSHVLGRSESFLNLVFGLQVSYIQSMDKLMEDINLFKPTIIIAVPRVFEKIHSKIIEQTESLPLLKKKIFKWSQQVSDKYFEKIERDLSPTTAEILLRNAAFNSTYSKIYAKFGGKIRFFVSGGAPLNPDIIRFFRNANLTVLEGYGLTETFGPVVINPVRKQIPGSVGLPLGEVKVKLAPDGEILIKSESLFIEYFKNPEETKSSFTEDGWYQTGDIGKIGEEGYLNITGRKKDIIITSGGKNIAPGKLENLFTSSPYISQFLVVGDGRSYLTGIVSIEKEDLLELLEKYDIDKSSSVEDISKDKNIINEIRTEIERINTQLAPFESIKNFIIAPHSFTIHSGHMTPSLKVKRKRVLGEFIEEIDALYRA